MDRATSILLVGVGGQGTILMSAIIAEGLVGAGYDVKVSEIHGMAQRGGSVAAQVRYGSRVYSPIIGKGGADILLSFEIMEALRWLEFVKPDGKVIASDLRIDPAPVLLGHRKYPEDILEVLSAKVDTTVIRAREIASSIGNARVANVVLLGALAEGIHLVHVDWEAAIASAIKPELLDLNLRAYRAGRAAAKHIRQGDP